MLRSLFRRPRTIRVPVNDGGVQVQEVKVVRRVATRSSNFVTTFFIAYFVYRYLESKDPFGWEQKSKTISEDLDNWKKDQNTQASTKGLSDHWKRQHAELQNDGPIRNPIQDGNTRPTSSVMQITIPVWIRAKQQPLYTSSDPEYREFVKLQSDKKRMDDLKRTVGKWTTARLKNPTHVANLAYIEFTGQVGIMMDIVPQLYPPPLYEVPCIGITDSTLFVGWRTLSPQLGTVMDQVFRPGVTFDAVTAAMSTFCSASYAITSAKLTSFLGTRQGSDYTPTSRTDLDLRSGQNPTTILSPTEVKKDNSIPSASNWPSNAQAMRDLIHAIHNGKAARERHLDLVKAVPYSSAVQLATATFKRTQTIGHAALKQQNSRGVVQIRGTISCSGIKGQYRMEVIAYYQPGEDAFLGPIVLKGAYVIKDYNRWEQYENQNRQRSSGIGHSGRSTSAETESTDRSDTSSGKSDP